MKQGARGRAHYFRGLAGAGTIEFEARIPDGSKLRTVGVEVDPEVIVALGRALEATKDKACDYWRDRSVPLHPADAGYQVGHACWHVTNRERVMPCIDPSRTIDMRSLPE